MKLKLFLKLMSPLMLLVACIGQPENQIEFKYPLNGGDQWNYHRSFTFYNFSPDSFYIDLPFLNEFEIIVKNEGIESINDSLSAFKIVATEKSEYGTSISVNYYQNRSDGLYLCAYNNSGGGVLILPKDVQKYSICYKGYKFKNIIKFINSLTEFPNFNSTIGDSIVIENPHLTVLQYPLGLNSHWIYRNNNNPWRIEKEIIGAEDVFVSPGRFYCYKIQWLYDMDNDNVWDDDIFIYDYVATIGLVRRQLIVKNIVFTNSMGNVVGSADLDDDIYLVKSPK